MPSPQGSQLPRLAVIGVTGYGSIYLQLLRETLARRSARLVAAVVINREQVPDIVAELQAAGAVIYSSAEEFFAREAGKVDVCLIPVGIAWHARLTIAALRAGMNVLVEKPLAGSLDDARAIRRAEQECSRWVAVGFQDLYSLEARWLKTQFLSGVIGRLEEIRMIGLWPRPAGYFNRNQWAGRAFAEGASVLDSPLNNAFAHFVNLALYFAGPSDGESATVAVDSAELFRAHNIEMFDTAVVRGVSAEGARFWFGVSHSAGATREPEIYVRGEKGSAEWWHEQRCVVTDANGRRQVFPLPSCEETRQLMFQAMLARLEDPSVFVCTTAIAMEHTRLIEDVQAAARVLAFPAASTVWTRNASGAPELPRVDGLADALDQACKTGSTLASVVAYAEPQLATP